MGEGEDAAIHIDVGHPQVFGEAARVIVGSVQGFAGGVMLMQTVTAGVAGDMMGDKNPLTNVITLYALSDLNNLSCDLMTEHQRGLFNAVPFHDVAAADATGLDLDQELAGADVRLRYLFKAHVMVVVVHCYAHVIFPGVDIFFSLMLMMRDYAP